MTRPEFLAWVEFYKLDPFDDYHRFARPAALIAHSFSGTEVDDLLGWLRKEPPKASRYSEADLAVLNAFGRKPGGK